MRAFWFVVAAAWGGPATANAKSIDYIIVGAGTSGLVVANRLSKDAKVTVTVVEAGTDQRDNPDVWDPTRFLQAFYTPIDWLYLTTKQPGAGNREIEVHQGKAWGGCSAINGMTYIRGDAAQFDAWEALGNPGWGWDGLLPYFKRSEQYIKPTAEQLEAGATYQTEHHGFGGPVRVSYVSTLVNTSASPAILRTWTETLGLGLKHSPDLNAGDVHGVGMGPQTVDERTPANTRWDAAKAYLHPVETRENLAIVQGTVTRLIWDKAAKQDGLAVASGIEYVTANGSTEILMAEREVIISAGALRSPLVLEASGVGNPSILRALDIEPIVDLPGVGENLLEQPNHAVAYFSTLPPMNSGYHTFVTMADLFGSDVSAVAEATRRKIPAWAESIAKLSSISGTGSPQSVATLEKLLMAQHDLLFRDNVTAAELVTVSAGELVATNYWILMPFSRGSVHLGSDQAPVIDPRFFLADFDFEATKATGKLAQKFWHSPLFASTLGAPMFPGPDVLPNDATDAQWDTHLRYNLSANAHPIGSAAMMPRDIGGVVDSELMVYGTANVRVVDASVLPIQFSGHPMAVLYAVAEKASDIILRASS